MDRKKVLAGAICGGLSFGLTALQVKAADELILPPDLRMQTSSSTPSQPPKFPKTPGSKKNAKKPDVKSKVPVIADKIDPKATAPMPDKPSKTKDDDRLSFGMKWNVDELSGSSPSPGSLSDVLDKNINGSTIGAGAQVGVKYKFDGWP